MTDYLRTLFLHPPAVDGFDGGAGSRYQARREVRSFWYPTWLAQPAALVPGSRLVDAPPDGLTLDDVRPLAQQYDLCVMHTSTPSFASDVRVAEALKAENPALVIGLVGAAVAVAPATSLQASAALVVRGPATSSTSRSRRWPRAVRFADVAGLSYRRQRPRGAHAGAPDARGHGRAALRDPGLQARPHRRALRHRLPAAPLRLALHRSRLPLEVHVLPLAADGGRAALPHPQPRARGRGDGAGGRGCSRRCASSSSTTTRSPTTCRARRRSRSGSAALGITWSVNAKANVPVRDAQGAPGQRAPAPPGGLRVRQPGDPQQREEGRAPRRARAASRATPSRSASPSTAPSSWACPARRARPSRRPSGSPREIDPTPSRSRWPRRTRAPRSTRRRSATAGSNPTTLVDGAGRAGERASATRTSRAPRSSSRWTCSIAASTSARAR